MIDANGVQKIYADHLDTPRRVADSTNTIVWSWESKPFGEDEANGSITMNLRFPGQYFDAETKTHYNINRDYNPVTGRYIQSDPIGLDGGISTFEYVGGNPLSRFDETGKIWDVIVDGIFIVYDVLSLSYHTVTGDTEAANTDKLALGADAVAAAIPGVTGAGLGIRAGTKITRNVKLLKTNYLKGKGIDPHMLKEEFLGTKNISKFDLYIDKSTKEILILMKGGKGEAIETGRFLH